jgi:lipopolysaccharide export system protein LptA
MWNPKRVLLLVFGMVIFTTAYGIYAHFLGGVDGLPELPEALLKEVETTGDGPILPPEIEVERKLKLAFGDDCQEQRRAIKLEIKARGLVLAADQFTIEHGGPRDGQVRLEPFSVAIFGKAREKGEYPEINTVRSDVAYLTFDQPITSAAEMGSHKIVGGELISKVRDADGERERHGPLGGVVIVNNRRTPQRDDDLTLYTPGPVFYQESSHMIWTQEAVKIIDEQSKPKPTRVDAIGMDVYLLTEAEDPKAHVEPTKKKPAKQLAGKDSASNVSGIKSIRLRSNVDMYLQVDGNSSFLGAPSNPAADKKKGEKVTVTAQATVEPADKKGDKTVTGQVSVEVEPAGKHKKDEPVHKDDVHIHTQGPFFYDALAEIATFDISQHPGPYPNNVDVTRKHDTSGANDQLICSHLELKLVRKQPDAHGATPADDRGMDMEIETAHATGEQLTLTSDAENLDAYGNDLVYNTRTRESTLKGSPEMIALKDGNEITARQLILLGVNGEKVGQQARAIGPGVVRMLNKQTNKRSQLARFKESMLVGKDGKYDLLILTGEASFEDLEQNQNLHGDEIKVWLEPDSTVATEKNGDNNSSQHRRPHHVEATGHVSAWSPGEMNVHDTERLVVCFEDAATPVPAPPAAPVATTPATAPVVAAKTPAPVATPPAMAASAPPTTVPARPTGPAPTAASPTEPEKPKRPIDLQAHYVEAHVRRTAAKNDLDRLVCEGDVIVIQDPSGPEDDGTDIRGETLQLQNYPEGHVLCVTGDLAKVKLEKMRIIGPVVHIDQKENKAWVEGLGSMRMPSDTNLASGEKLTKPTELTVYWNRDMFFNGRYALFHGGVQAEQENGHLACQTMQVYLDRFVSLKQGEKNGPPAKVKRLVCDKSVRVEDCKRDEVTRQLISYQRLINPVLSVDNEDNIVEAPGPGEVRLLQLGAKDESAQETTPRDPAGKSTAEQEMKLTRVTYLGHMLANNVTHTAIFRDNVEVIHVPSEDVNMSLDPDKLPPGGMYLRSDQLKVYNRRDAAGKGHQELEAIGRGVVQAQEFWGRADTIKYDESKALVIFESKEGNLATLYKVLNRGTQPQEIRGKKIFYWRRTNDFKIEDGRGIIAPNASTSRPMNPTTPTPAQPTSPYGTTPPQPRP